VPCDGRSLGRIADAVRTEAELQFEEYETPAPIRPSGRRTPPSEIAVRRIFTRPDDPREGGVVRHIEERHPSPDGVRRPAAGESPALLHDNGLGGLSGELDYVVRVRGDDLPPAPWINVIANDRGGFLVSERGTGCTWGENSYFYRLTPWNNDPVSDPATEAIYLRDENSGDIWCPTPAPLATDAPYVVRHGAGTSTFEHQCGDIHSLLTLGVDEREPVKLTILRLTNRGPRHHRLTVTSYVEWTLGALREHTQHQVHTTFDGAQNAIYAANYFDPQFAHLVAYCASSEPVTGHTTDRREFVGRNGSLSNPTGLHIATLSGATGVGIDPCAVLRASLSLAPGESRDLVFALGVAEGEEAARRASSSFRDVRYAAAAVARNVERWQARLSVITVRTPEPTFDAMVNRWALYQALACRVWARTALYQSSGAYGFRDQLQDVTALLYAAPALAREHILRATARQFVEGDVQHWWHPQSGRGVRTRFSDDLAWLPFVVDRYITVTGDESVLDESVPFLSMRPLEPHEHEAYELPQVSAERASVYEHCLRALRRACTVGEHGLPLIGIGDWNDGMNRVGVAGRGESVWLAWFLIANLRAFASHAATRGEKEVVAELSARAEGYVSAVETHGWDGDWYRRAYFDDGTPLGSSLSDECKIDSIAQSWSVISGAGDPSRQARAMRSLEEHLVDEAARVIRLLTPPFDLSPNDPGYIKGYLPGVRENGAQYTHAALWAVLATALRGDGDRAFELFQMLNPLMHSRTPEEVATYKTEPYVIAADVYTAPGHLGRGGWTWYTGSASWMYRVALEAILGLDKRGDTITITPRVPRHWREFSLEYRVGRSVYRITVQEPGAITDGVAEMSLDGRLLERPELTLVDDGERHDVSVRIRQRQPRSASVE
jgi:cyclic beta-1,2-glucan synthetase